MTNLTAEEYVIKKYPKIGDNRRLVRALSDLQRFNPDRPDSVTIPYKILDWDQKLRYERKLDKVRSAVNPENKKPF